MSSLCLAAVTLWHLGYPEQALKSSQAAVALAREVAHPFSLAYALQFLAWCHQFRREEQKAKEQAEAGMVLSIEHGVPLFLAQNTILRGWVLAEQGHGFDGLAQMRQELGLPSHRYGDLAAAILCFAGRGAWKSRTGRGRTERSVRSANAGG
jgi:hypothetical protein